MKNNIEENYLGLSFFNQLRVYDKFLETLQNEKNKKVSKRLKDTFDNYFEFKINLHEAINNISYLNNSELKELEKKLLEEINEYKDDYYDRKESLNDRIRLFNYHLGSFYLYGTYEKLNKILFCPEKLTDADTDLFIY